MLKRILRSRKAVSPVVSTVFLMSIMVAAVGISLGIIWPAMQEMNDNMELINAASSLDSVDFEIKNLISNGEGGKVSTTLELGQTGFLATDFNGLSTILLLQSTNGGAPVPVSGISTYYLPLNRFVISQTIDQDVMAKNTHQYLEGSGVQSSFFLNESAKAVMPWVIMNQSRGATDQVNSSLAYRGLITPSKIVNYATARISLVISIQYIQFDFPGKLFRGGHNPGLSIEYHTLNITKTPTVTVPDYSAGNRVFQLKISTQLEGYTTVQVPFTHETPGDGFLDIQLEFVIHHISLRF